MARVKAPIEAAYDREARKDALLLAHSHQLTADEVVRVAEKYRAFLQGESEWRE